MLEAFMTDAGFTSHAVLSSGQVCTWRKGGIYVEAEQAALLFDTDIKARIDELRKHLDTRCICQQSGINACDSLWHHNNNIKDRILELEKAKEELAWALSTP